MKEIKEAKGLLECLKAGSKEFDFTKYEVKALTLAIHILENLDKEKIVKEIRDNKLQSGLDFAPQDIPIFIKPEQLAQAILKSVVKSGV